MENSCVVYVALLSYLNKTAKTLKTKQFEVLVSTLQANHDNYQLVKASSLLLPSFSCQNDVPEHLIHQKIISKIYEITCKKQNNCGLKVKRIIFAGSKQVTLKSSVTTIRLYVVPLLCNFDTEAPCTSKFINLPALSSHIDSNSDLYSKEVSNAIIS